jgi:hypothetical protein
MRKTLIVETTMTIPTRGRITAKREIVNVRTTVKKRKTGMIWMTKKATAMTTTKKKKMTMKKMK